MTGRWRSLLIGLVSAAVVVEAAGAVSWFAWRHAMAVIEVDPDRGAGIILKSTLLRLPGALRRARRLPVRALAEAGNETAADVLDQLSTVQTRWTPIDPAGYVNLGRARLIRGDLAEAQAAFDAALSRDPNSAAAHRLAAMAYRASGMNDRALDHLATARALGLSSSSDPFELTPEEEGWVRLEALKRRMTAYPRTMSTNSIALARELRDRGQAGDGRGILEDIRHDPRVALELVRWDLLEGKVAEAEVRLRALLERRELPAAILAEGWTLRAMVRDRAGDYDGAVAAADRALALDPGSSGPYRVLATLAERRGADEAALEHLRTAWGMSPTDVGLLLDVARVAEKTGSWDDASMALKRAVSVAPDDPRLRAQLVDYLIRRGELMEATVTLSEALDRFPTEGRLLRLAERLRAEVSRR